MRRIMQYDDIRPISIEDYLAAHVKQAFPSEEAIQNISLEEQAVVKLIEMDIPAKTARACVKKAMAGQKSGQPLGRVIQKAFKMTLNLDSDDISPEAPPDERDLRGAGAEEPYCRLREAGVISDDKDEW